MSLFDKISDVEIIKASNVARTKQRALVTVTVTKSRITNNFSALALSSSSISIDDHVDITYSKDGKYLMLEVIEGGLKLLTQGNREKISNASVRLTNKEGVYPEFLDLVNWEALTKEDEVDKVVLVNGEIEYDKDNRRLVCELKVK